MSSGNLWIFAYGSLMWRPDFALLSANPARLSGYHRALCVRSTHYRGTRERPGLVFGLDRGGVCDGIAFEVAASDATKTLQRLRQRELIYGVYREVNVPVDVRVGSGWRTIDAVTYVAERAHGSYVGDLHAAKIARIVRQAHGTTGSNLAYLAHTLEHLRQLGLKDRCLERVGVFATPIALRRSLQAPLAQSSFRKPSGSSGAMAHGAPVLKPIHAMAQSRFGHRARISSY